MEKIWSTIEAIATSPLTALFLLFPLFIGIVVYVYSGKRRSERLESYRYIPLQDGDDEADIDKEQKADHHEQRS
ncbi:MAG: cbb3-type cytochrome c oxidase subunit 3 [Gammaproteobacteria bacterium]